MKQMSIIFLAFIITACFCSNGSIKSYSPKSSLISMMNSIQTQKANVFKLTGQHNNQLFDKMLGFMIKQFAKVFPLEQPDNKRALKKLIMKVIAKKKTNKRPLLQRFYIG
jgi:hypothetical protein